MFFSGEENINTLQDIFNLVKEYLQAQKELTLVTLAEKLTVLLSAIAVAIIMTIIGALALLFLVLTLAHKIEPLVGGMTESYAIITGGLLLLMALTYAFRSRIIYRPITKFLVRLLISEK